MDFSELKSWTKFFLGDPNGTRFNVTRLNKAVNLANKQFALDGKPYKDQSYTVSGGDATKSLPSDFIAEVKVKFDGKKLDPISEETIESVVRDQDWQDTNGTPSWYIINPEEASKSIRLYPKYKSGGADKTMVLRYLFRPADMSADSDEPLDGYDYLEIYHEAIAAYAAWLLLGGVEPTPGTSDKSQRMRQLYEDKKDECLAYFKNTTSEPWGTGGGRQGKRKDR